jgi:DNA-binding transcriptional MerR regulator
MESGELSIGELADAAGLSRRAVRFYVQQKLLPMPLGRGRGRHYDESHLQRLRQIGQLQHAGHSLDAIRRILDGQTVPAPPLAPAAPRRTPAFAAELWTRLRLMDGVELSFDTSKHHPDVQALLRLREAVQTAFAEDQTQGRSV